MILQKVVLRQQLCVQTFAVNCRKTECGVRAEETGKSVLNFKDFPISINLSILHLIPL